jgi:ABC-type lipoprotein release transport system permease subunit
MIGAYSGYVKVNGTGYWEEKNLDFSMEYSQDLIEELDDTKGVNGALPRIESFALAASLELTKGAMVVGIDPAQEAKFGALNERVADGEYLLADDKAVLLGAGLAKYLKLKVGDTLVLLGQGFHAASAAGKYPIKGIVKFGSPELSKQLVFLPLKEAQWLYAMENRITGLVLQVEDPEQSLALSADLRKNLGEKYEVLHWTEHSPELDNMIKTDKVEGWVFMFILYLVIAFGIFSTILMMLQERKHELGVMIAIGMKRMKLATMVWMEVIIISLLGAFLGMLGAFPVCLYFYLNPIQLSEEMGTMMEEYGMEAVLQSSIDPEIFLQQAGVVAMIACLIAIYPFIKLLRMKAIQAMRS